MWCWSWYTCVFNWLHYIIAVYCFCHLWFPLLLQLSLVKDFLNFRPVYYNLHICLPLVMCIPIDSSENTHILQIKHMFKIFGVKWWKIKSSCYYFLPASTASSFCRWLNLQRFKNHCYWRKDCMPKISKIWKEVLTIWRTWFFMAVIVVWAFIARVFQDGRSGNNSTFYSLLETIFRSDSVFLLHMDYYYQSDEAGG